MSTHPQRTIVTTADGSSTLFVPHWDEHYHSVHGAIQESMHVFIDAGFRAKVSTDEPLRIFEVGFGTGLNAWLTLLESELCSATLHYHAIEAYPLLEEEYQLLNYAKDKGESEQNFFLKIHQANWNESVEITPRFHLKKLSALLENWQPDTSYDLIYFDAFAPSAQEELWSETIFKQMFEATKPEGILVTYCAKGSVKRAMKSAGWQVVALPGPPGKREMTKAIKIA